MGWHEGDNGDVHVRKADWFAPIYATKQRKWMGPEIEDKIATRQGRRPWEKGAHIAGPRLTFTMAAKALMAGRAAVMAAIMDAEGPPPQNPAVISSSHPEPPIVEARPATNAVQLPLFGVLPERRYLQPSDLRSFRQARGYTQAEISRWAGIRNRSHIANFERGHDGLSPYRQRALKHFMETQGPQRMVA
jgi:hypothetical protein